MKAELGDASGIEVTGHALATGPAMARPEEGRTPPVHPAERDFQPFRRAPRTTPARVAVVMKRPMSPAGWSATEEPSAEVDVEPAEVVEAEDVLLAE